MNLNAALLLASDLPKDRQNENVISVLDEHIAQEMVDSLVKEKKNENLKTDFLKLLSNKKPKSL